MQSALRLIILYGCVTAAGFLFAQLGVPLPWMIGPLVVTATASMAGITKAVAPNRTRPFGQIVVATFVGAHFTPDALHSLLSTAPLLISVSLYVLIAALIVARFQQRLFHTSPIEALLSVVPTSPVEAGVLAEKFGLDRAPIILAQTIRIAVVVTSIPILLQLGSFSGGLPPATPHKDGLIGIAITLSGAAMGPVVFHTLRFSNPFFLGPLFLAALISSLGLPSYDVPGPILAAAQIVLGTWLGSALRRDLFAKGSTLIWAIATTTALLLALCVLGAWLLAKLFDMPFATVMLGIAPGGVTEMALTAGILGQDVALVTAMHITRIFAIMPNLGWLARLTGDPQSR